MKVKYGWLTLVLAVLLVTLAAGEQVMGAGGEVLVWNRLGSVEEIAHSKIGPGLQQVSYLYADWQEAQIAPARFGHGLYVNHDTNEGWSNDGANFFALDTHAAGLSPDRGTIEFWFQFEYDASTHNTAYFIMTAKDLVGHFPDDEMWDGRWVELQWNGWNYPDRKFFSLAYGDTCAAGTIQADTPVGSAGPGGVYDFHPGDLFHFAMVWDLDGIDGSADTLRLYVNGALAAATTETPGTGCDYFNNYLYVGSQPNYNGWDHYYNAVKGVTDNLVIWDRAVVNFDHRFQEAPLTDVEAEVYLMSEGALWVLGQDVFFPDTILGGTDVTLTAADATWNVRDTTHTGAGWHVTLSADDLSDGLGHTIDVNHFTVQVHDAEILVVGANSSPLPTSQTPTPTPLTPVGVTILAAGLNEGMGVFTFPPHFQLLVPATTVLGDAPFTTLVTITMIVGP